MSRKFQLDGKSHSVATDDTLVLIGPGTFVGNTSGEYVLRTGDTITMLFETLLPGEAVTISSDVKPTTTFFRPLKDGETVAENQREYSQPLST